MMVSAEERMRILKMISEKQITADEGARLLEALRASGGEAGRVDGGRARWLRVKVTDRGGDRVKLNVTIPIGLVDIALKMGARFAPELSGMDSNLIQSAIHDGIQGRVLSVDDQDDNERVEIFVE
jgi:hypothetical protein